MASEKKRGPVALRLGLSPGLPLSRYEFSANAMRRQFWDVPKFGLGLSLGIHKIGTSGLGPLAEVPTNSGPTAATRGKADVSCRGFSAPWTERLVSPIPDHQTSEIRPR
jgi:hypothetical protein